MKPTAETAFSLENGSFADGFEEDAPANVAHEVDEHQDGQIRAR